MDLGGRKIKGCIRTMLQEGVIKLNIMRTYGLIVKLHLQQGNFENIKEDGLWDGVVKESTRICAVQPSIYEI